MQPSSFCPASLAELQAAIAEANRSGRKLEIAEPARFNQALAHEPENLIVTVGGGARLADLQQALARAGQWLPLDPAFPEEIAIGDMLLQNRSGPRRLGYGAAREHVLGLQLILGSGEVIRTGGKVVKNVAGYDLAKLFIGSEGTLGWILEATFKLRPLPEKEIILSADAETLGRAGEIIAQIQALPADPAALDCSHFPAPDQTPRWRVTAAFAGVREDVQTEADQARRAIPELGAGDLNHDAEFWRAANAGPARTISCLPSRWQEAAAPLNGLPWIARAPLGQIQYRGGPAPPAPPLPRSLFERVKEAYDPNRILAEIPW